MIYVSTKMSYWRVPPRVCIIPLMEVVHGILAIRVVLVVLSNRLSSMETNSWLPLPKVSTIPTTPAALGIKDDFSPKYKMVVVDHPSGWRNWGDTLQLL